jgi:hypothetical protein
MREGGWEGWAVAVRWVIGSRRAVMEKANHVERTVAKKTKSERIAE